MKFLSEGPDSRSGASAVYIRGRFSSLGPMCQKSPLYKRNTVSSTAMLPGSTPFPGSSTTCHFVSPCNWLGQQVAEALGLQATAQVPVSGICERVRTLSHPVKLNRTKRKDTAKGEAPVERGFRQLTLHTSNPYLEWQYLLMR